MRRLAACVLGLCLAATIAGQAAPGDPPTLRELYAEAPSTWPAPTLQPGATFSEFGPLPPAPQSPDNPSTPERIALGRALFDDPRLSGSGQVACASCHSSELGFGDGLRTSFGHNRTRGRRNAQPLFVSAWMTRLFWDGRAPSLEAQALIPIGHPDEMAANRQTVEARLNADARYRQAFAAAYGADPITLDHVGKALAVFERSLKPRRSKWDRALTEGTGVLTDQELRGLHLFRGKAGCANCHSGPLFSDQKFHNLGLSFYGRSLQDLGRYGVTGDAADVGAFRTASLRNLTATAPYMHNGLFPTLEGVVSFYNAGAAQPRRRADQANDPLFPTTSRFMKPLNLDAEERADLVAYLRTL